MLGSRPPTMAPEHLCLHRREEKKKRGSLLVSLSAFRNVASPIPSHPLNFAAPIGTLRTPHHCLLGMEKFRSRSTYILAQLRFIGWPRDMSTQLAAWVHGFRCISKKFHADRQEGRKTWPPCISLKSPLSIWRLDP